MTKHRFALANAISMAIPFFLGFSLFLTTLAFLATPALAQDQVISTGVASIDLPESHAKKVSLEIVDGSFNFYNAGKIRLEANNIDFRNGSLGGLNVNLNKGDFDNIWVDQMTINTAAFNFDTYELLNNRRFSLAQPVNGTVNLLISEAGINHFLQHPKTLDKLEKSIAKKTGGLKVITFADPKLKFIKDNQVQLDVTGIMGGSVMVPMQMVGQLALKNSNPVFQNLKVISENSEVPMPVDVTKVMEKQLNDMLNLQKLGKDTFVIKANSLKMKKGVLELAGNATFTRLEFGGKKTAHK
ncbi:MAG: LmeA family phospholipid-binding protein [Vampirovibrionales bacterium]|nr:LmeA family phospholipid-binding protein [Vampirovibrionales bacterium]